MRYHIVTLGCAKNVADTERIARVLGEGSHHEVSEPGSADMVIVNTCGFIDASKEESVNTILELAAAKSDGQQLVVAGCLTALHGAELQAEIPQIDAVFGAEDWAGIGSYVQTLEPVRLEEPPLDIPEPARTPRPSAYLKISDGCNAPCTFCIIPKMKGKLHSTPADALVAEARLLAAGGVREIVLVAQDSTDYGRDLGLRDALPELLERLSDAVPEVPWLRIMYAYPGHVTARLAQTMARLPNVTPYIDIPLQHAAESVLRRMKRPSNKRMVRDMLDTLRQAMPDISIRTTFIVGYPGETDDEFEELLGFVREMAFDHVGCFTFSPQSESPAAHEPNPVLERVKKRRQRQLMEVAQQVSIIKNRAMVGREIDVLVESMSAGPMEGIGTDFVVGRSYRDAPEVDGLVLLRGTHAPGDFVRSRVTQSLAYDLVAEPVG
ncbi:MAG: 30S ribosomal protein S12 methylthiotransferase RimO [Chloroflexi bacterium]|nr:30S ribosomal protein S12 methylthiotransferase RimO [Chloroflexota bacterium]